MTIKELKAFIYYAQGAGFTTMGEVCAYMRIHKMTERQFALKVKALEYTTIDGKSVKIAEFDAYNYLVCSGSIRTKLVVADGLIQYKTI